MRKLAAFVLFIVLMLTACRSESDRSAVAQVPREGDGSTSLVQNGGAGVPGVELRRLWAGGYSSFDVSSISPDGRYLSMTDWSTLSSLAVRDLSKGELHHLATGRYEEGEPWEGALASLFSPDGRRIVYSWLVEPDVQLRMIEFDPGDAGVPRAAEPTVVFHNPELAPYFPFDWSPDGRLVLAKVSTTGKTKQLALISTTDGTYRPLKSFDWREPLRAEFSPDGRYVAYDFPPELESSNRDLFVVSVDGTYETRVVDGPGIDRLLGWHPDGSILFRSDRGGTPGVWRIPMSDGRTAGPTELIQADMWEVEPLGLDNDRFYYGVSVNPTRVYTAPVDLEAGELAGPPVAVDDPSQIRIVGWDWSPDGKFLAYSGSSPGAHGASPGARGSVIVIRSDRGERVRTIPLDLRATSRIRWDPDGRSLIVSSYDARGRRGFYRIDLEAGSYTTIVRNDQLEDPTPRGDFDISPDGRTIWFATREDGRWTLVAYDLESGSSRAITPLEWRVRGPAMAWWLAMVSASPDGRRLAVTVPDTTSSDRLVGTIPAGGGRFTALARIPDRCQIRGPEWSPDGRFLVYATCAPDGWTTWVVPADGGQARPLELVPFFRPHGPPLRLHPDGRRIAFRAGESRGEVWVMEGLGTTSPIAAGGGGTP